MSFGPTAKCFFCGGVYYVEKLASHEFICSMRPGRLTVMKAADMACKSHPEASADFALLVRLVWQIRDAYRTEQPLARLTDPRLIFRASLKRKEKGRGKVRTHKQSECCTRSLAQRRSQPKPSLECPLGNYRGHSMGR